MKLDNPLNVRNIHKKDPHVIKKMKEKKFTYIVLRLFASFCELSGDRISSDDHAFISGVESFHGCPVTVIGHQKGKGSVEEALYRNWGMPSPQGYRKVMRLAKQVEKFHKPVIFFCRHNWYRLRKRSRRGGTGNSNCQCSTGNEYTENYNFINCLGEGGSGGALVLGLGNQVWMLENAVYSIFTPESYASIIWRDNTRTVEAASLMNLQARDLYESSVIEKIIYEEEPVAVENMSGIRDVLEREIYDFLINYLKKKSPNEVAKERYQKFRKFK